MTTDSGDIWIVERVRSVEHDCGSQHVVTWHASPEAAGGEARRLQAEFDLACKLAGPWHEVVDTLFDMYQQESFEKQHGWIDCDDDACGYLERSHRHHTFVTPCEADQALIEQLQDWWHAERNAWQAFVEDEIFSRMSDPPRYVSELVTVDVTVRYEVRLVRRGTAAAEGRLAAWARDRAAAEGLPPR